jgi:hypothetical protein
MRFEKLHYCVKHECVKNFSMHDEEFNSIFLFIFLRSSFSVQVDRRRYLTIEERGKEKNEGKEERRKRKGLT